MQICLIMDKPETRSHPVISTMLRELGTRHDVYLLDVRSLTGEEAIERAKEQPRADIYLLKSHTPQGLEVGRYLEQQGALVLNSWEASVVCLDRVELDKRMHGAGLPWPRTWGFPTLGSLLERQDVLDDLTFPVIIKSAYSHTGDLVGKVKSVEQLRELGGDWSQEPVVLQEFAAGDGWDIKMWVIDQHIYAARRRTPLEANASVENFPVAEEDLPDEWAHIALEVGRVLDLRLYGVDLLMTEKGPVIVDINAFPGFRGVPGAETALAALVERIGRERGFIQ